MDRPSANEQAQCGLSTSSSVAQRSTILWMILVTQFFTEMRLQWFGRLGEAEASVVAAPLLGTLFFCLGFLSWSVL